MSLTKTANLVRVKTRQVRDRVAERPFQFAMLGLALKRLSQAKKFAAVATAVGPTAQAVWYCIWVNADNNDGIFTCQLQALQSLVGVTTATLRTALDELKEAGVIHETKNRGTADKRSFTFRLTV